MRKFLHGIFQVMAQLIILVNGLSIIFILGFRSQTVNAMPAFLTAHKLSVMLGGLGLILLFFASILTAHRKTKNIRFLSFDTQGGQVSMSGEAIHTFLQKIGSEFRPSISLDPFVTPRRKGLDVETNLTVRSGARVPELSKILQTRIRESMRDDLGFTQIRHVSVKVRQIVGSPQQKPEQIYNDA